MNKLQQANFFIDHGISVIPLRHRGKEPESSLMGGTWERYKSLLSTGEDLTRWLYSDWQNYGVVCGWRDLVVIDFDEIGAFSMWMDWFMLLNKHGEVYPMPYIVKSARGAHVYIACPTLDANEKRRGVDVKCHGYVVGPGSIHPSGAEYMSITDFRLIDVYSLETFLPSDLFPKVVADTSVASTPCFLSNSGIVASTVDDVKPFAEYDPYQVAMFGSNLDLLSKVKSQVRIENFFSQTFKTSGDGRWLSTLCIFHDDKHPSMWIDTKRQLCGCAACGFKPLDVVNLYARIHNMSDAEAVTAMAREIGVWG